MQYMAKLLSDNDDDENRIWEKCNTLLTQHKKVQLSYYILYTRLYQ